MKIQKYKRGQIWWYHNNAVWDGGTYNQGKSRPVIIVSNEMANANSNVLIAIPCTSQTKKEMPTHTVFELNEITNTAMAECLMSVATDKLGAYIGTVDSELMEKLEKNILVALGMKEFLKEKTVKRVVIYNIKNLVTKNTSINELNNPAMQLEKSIQKVNVKQIKTKRIKNKRLNIDEKKEFLKEYKSKDKNYMIDKYNLKDIRALQQKAYIFRKQLKEDKL